MIRRPDHRTQLLDRAAAPGGPLVFTGSTPFIATATRMTVASEAVDADWADDVVRLLRPRERALLSLAFDVDGPAVAHLVTPTPVHDDPPPRRTPEPVRHHVTAVPTEARYADQVRLALGRIAAGDLHKVVLGRCLDVVSSPPMTPDDVVSRLLASRPGRFVFGLPVSAHRHGAWLVGASPELLVRRTGHLVANTPLAGSIPRSPDPTEDRRRAAALQESTKDRAEHAYVVQAILASLRTVCTDVEAAPEPHLTSTDTLWHLATPIRGRLRDPGRTSALHLARLLHPTPAVGGVPTPAALGAIAELEGDLRGPLAGAVGWVDADGDGELAVAIRAGVLMGERLRLFAGAGIVAGSDPDSEVRENGAKLATMARAVGLSDAPTAAATS
ncbi:isochorismate synthase [soil metagenome]